MEETSDIFIYNIVNTLQTEQRVISFIYNIVNIMQPSEFRKKRRRIIRRD